MGGVVGVLLLALSWGFLAGCSEGRERPPGYVRVGKARELLAPETFLYQRGLLIRRDERGFSVMSTQCTYDLSTLARKLNPAGDTLVSRYSESTYRLDGSVLTGPARAPLPYYEAALDQGAFDGPVDTLYVRIGKRVSPEWRLAVPAELLTPPSRGSDSTPEVESDEPTPTVP